MAPVAVGPMVDGRAVVVTGASSGLGEAYARALVAAGARVVLVARRREALVSLAAELGSAVPVVGDVGDPRLADRVVDAAISNFGALDAVVNNAGGVRDRTLLKMSDAEFDEVVQSHLYGTFYVTRACARAMRERGGGTIINIGSDSGLLGAFGQSNYAAAKGAVLGLTLTWARELPGTGSPVTACSPTR